MALRDSLLNFIGEDILHLIILQASQTDLSALSQLSRVDRAFIEPFLYARINWTWNQAKTPPAVVFLRTILGRPELASHVQSLELLGDYDDLSPPRHPLPTISVDDLDFHEANEAIDIAEVQHADRWKEALHQGTMDAVIALLLSRLHELRRLILGTNITKETELLGMTLRSCLSDQAHTGLSAFRHLREVTFDSQEDCERRMIGRQTADFLPLFSMPVLQYLSVGLDNPETIQWSDTKSDASHLHSLKVALIREKPLNSLLSMTRVLTSLHWDWHYNSSDYHSSNTKVVRLDEFIIALNHVRHSLESLRISASCVKGYSGLEMPFIEMRGSMRGLARFSRLKKLSLPWAFMMTFSPDNGIQLAEVMPFHLEDLTITDDLHVHEAIVPGTEETTFQNEWHETTQLEIIARWLRHRGDTHPNLLDFWFRLENSGGDWPADMREELSRLCNIHGVRIKITWDERYD